jgi:hypothetical protein
MDLSANRNLAPVGDGNRGAVTRREPPPVDEVAAALMHKGEAVRAQETGHLGRGKWPEFRHESVGGAGRYHPASADV